MSFESPGVIAFNSPAHASSHSATVSSMMLISWIATLSLHPRKKQEKNSENISD
jgi:hypothetical protein